MLQQRAFRVLGAARHSESATPLGKAPHVELANASWYMITDLILTMLPQILEIQTLGPAGLHWGQIPAFEASYDSNIWGPAVARVQTSHSTQLIGTRVPAPRLHPKPKHLVFGTPKARISELFDGISFGYRMT